MELPTIKIKCPENLRAGYAVINEADFDAERHELFDDAALSDTADDNPMSDDELRTAIEAATGERPHHRTGRAKLLEAFNALPVPSGE